MHSSRGTACDERGAVPQSQRPDRESAEEHASASETVAFYCECSDRDCTERILITAQEFENVREHAAQFLVRPGHDVPSVEIVVTSTPLYFVVEKTGEAAEYVTEHLDDG